MGKKVLVLSASPRKGGNSDTLCDELIRGAEEAGHQTEKIFLKDKNVNYCLGCGNCSNYGKSCPQKDDMEGILQKMIDADVIVLATPVYFYSMNAQLKTVIDRCCAGYTKISGKDFYFIITAAEEDIEAMEATIQGLRGFTSCLPYAVERGIIYGLGAWLVGEISNKPAMGEAFEAGRNI